MEKSYPAFHIYTFGDLKLERLMTSSLNTDQPPVYEVVGRSAWSNRGPALTLLKVLLCRDGRRALKDFLIDALWDGEIQHTMKSAENALHAAASVLRTILRSPNGENMLITTSGSDGVGYKLLDQQSLWIDADAFLIHINEALKSKLRVFPKPSMQLMKP